MKSVRSIGFKVVLLLVCMGLFFACGGKAAEETNRDKKVEPIIVKYATVGAPAGLEYDCTEWAMKEVERRTQGRVKMQTYYSGSLLTVKEMLEGTQKGAADMSTLSGTWSPSQIPYQSIVNSPMFGPNVAWMADPVNQVNAYFEFWDHTPELQGELKNWNQSIWGISVFGPYGIFSTKPVTELADLKNLTIRAVGFKSNYLFKKMGAIPVASSPADMYSGLQKGTFNAAWAGTVFGDSYGLPEVAKYFLEANLYEGTSLISVNLDTLRRMTPEDQKTFMDIGREYSFKYATAMRDEIAALYTKWREEGNVITVLDPSIRDTWQRATEPQCIEDWLREKEKAGVPDIRRLTKKWYTIMGAPEVVQDK